MDSRSPLLSGPDRDTVRALRRTAFAAKLRLDHAKAQLDVANAELFSLEQDIRERYNMATEDSFDPVTGRIAWKSEPVKEDDDAS